MMRQFGFARRGLHRVGVVATTLFLAAAFTGAAADVSLRERLERHVTQEKFAAAQWGVKVVSLKSGKTLFAHNADKLLIPASNAKLYTGALALDQLGPDFRFETSFYALHKPDADGTLHGNLTIRGGGDPSFAARFHDGNYERPLAALANAIRDAGVKNITGGLRADDSFFIGPPLGFGWQWDDLQEYYAAEVSALTVQENVIDLVFQPAQKEGQPATLSMRPKTGRLRFVNRVKTGAKDSERRVRLYRPIGESVVYADGVLPLGDKPWGDAVSVHEPELLFLEQAILAMGRAGVAVKEAPLAAQNDKAKTQIKLGSVKSRPLPEILNVMMKRSQNLYAQLLLLQVGARAGLGEERTTEQAGLRELRAFLKRLGIPEHAALLEEGAGLSRGALVTPSATIQLLQKMREHPHAKLFLDSLPIAGVDGTLRSRMKGTAAEGKVRAKTGTLRYTHALSGYVTSRRGEELVFAIMLNNQRNPDSNSSTRAELDAIAVMLAEW